MGYVGQGADRDSFAWDGTRQLWVPAPSYLWWGGTQLNSITADGYFNAGQRTGLADTLAAVSTFPIFGPARITLLAATVRALTHPVNVTYIVELDGADTALQMTLNAGDVSGSQTGDIAVPAGEHFVRMKFNASAINTDVRRYLQFIRIEPEAA